MLKRIIIYAEEIKELEGCSISTAYERIRLAKAALGKKKHHKLTIADFCSYYDYDLDVVMGSIYNSKKAS
jgi:hypothetical protein